MKYTVIASILAVAMAADVNDLVQQIPICAVNCIRDGAQSVNCDITNFACSCQNVEKLTASVVPCLGTSGCSSADQAQVIKIAGDICSQVSNEAVSGTQAAATQLTASPTATPGSAASRLQAAGWAGAVAAVAAFAL
ncbi:hypothetical protein CCHL11_06346 [Colletotrichum chlorophyti]|uniref:CFEM domain-containing protein n=1 Tax=Colletotrichum chlorophyti TaxID=708187 RepID=A0A1Q8RQ05_9PEZI|nr:hypothetical protein CCHL11_06346 [Colletotrichum chlorophyti]